MADRFRLRMLPDERILLEANEGILTLTTHRVRLDQRASRGSRLVSITLDAVASCGLVTRTHPLLLVVAGIVALLALTQMGRGSSPAAIAMLLAAGALVVAYLVTRSAVLAIASAGDTITVAVKGMSRDAVADFIDALEQAKVHWTGPRSP